jgi:hypothetical protein
MLQGGGNIKKREKKDEQNDVKNAMVIVFALGT